MRADKVTFLDIIIFIGGLYWVFTTESSETFWTISVSLSLMFLAKSYLLYISNIKKNKTDEEEFETDEDTNYQHREILIHQVEDGLFIEDFGDGIDNETEVKGQRHKLIREYQSTEEGKDEWYEYESEIEDEFYLTGNDEGQRYIEDDLVNFFKIENWEWTFNGTNIVPGCGIEKCDDNDTIQKKWDSYKNKFPKISSKSQFNFKTKND